MVSKYAKADPRFFHTRERINFMNNRSWKLAIERTIGEITSKMVIDIPKEFCAELERITYAEHTTPVEDLKPEVDDLCVIMCQWVVSEYSGWRPVSLLSEGV